MTLISILGPVQSEEEYHAVVTLANIVRTERLEYIETLEFEPGKDWGRKFVEMEWQCTTMKAYDEWMVSKGRTSNIQAKD